MSTIGRLPPGGAGALQAQSTQAGEAPATAQDTRNPRLLQAARMYEQQFLREMVRAMRGTVSESELMPASMGEKIYREQLDDNYVEEWSNTGGIGFADMIYNHVMDRYMNQRGQQLPRPKGPLPINGTPSFNFKVQEQGNGTKIQIQRPQSNLQQGTQNLVSPWDAKATLVEGQGLKAYILDHQNGMRSTIAFEGVPVIADGQTVKAGGKLASLASESKDIFWNLEKVGG